MIWLIGNKGMLGSEVERQLQEKKLNFVGTGREIDVTDVFSLENFANDVFTDSYYPSDLPHSERKITWIINCSGYTNVEKAEEETEKAEKLNYQGCLNIARLARKIGAKLIHVSTDYVFNGKEKKPYSEEAQKNPLGVYGKTKSQGEDAIQKEMTAYYILRTAWLYGFNGKNFVYAMTNAMQNRDSVKVVNDQKGTPTCASDLAEIIVKIIEKSNNAKGILQKNSAPAFGIYHFTDEGETTWFEFAKEIYRLGKKYGRISNECVINPCATQEYGAKAERPAYSVLSKTKIAKELKIKIPNWETSLEKFIKNARFVPER